MEPQHPRSSESPNIASCTGLLIPPGSSGTAEAGSGEPGTSLCRGGFFASRSSTTEPWLLPPSPVPVEGFVCFQKASCAVVGFEIRTLSNLLSVERYPDRYCVRVLRSCYNPANPVFAGK